MAKVTIRRNQFYLENIDKILEDPTKIASEEFQKKLRYLIEYTIHPDEGNHSTAFYVARDVAKSRDSTNPPVYLIFKVHALRGQIEGGRKTEKINPYPVGYETSTEEADKTAYELALKSATTFKENKGFEIDDQTELKESKLETNLQDNEFPSAMWEVQPGA